MKLNSAIYLDYNATTPVAPEVMNEMLPYFLSSYGNASSADHIYGWQAKEAVEEARKRLARNLGAKPNEIIFTAGATESINLALRGLMAKKSGRKHIITVKTEHNAVLDTCKVLENKEISVTYLSVNADGRIDLAELERAITPDTALVSIMWVNNETGVIQPIAEIADICTRKGIVFMSDATQAVGKLKIALEATKIDIIMGSAHKIYGPKGVGFLYLRGSFINEINPIITGGGQEFKMRAGTTNVPGIIGLDAAVQLALDRIDEDSRQITKLRDLFEEKLLQSGRVAVNGSKNYRLFNTSNLMFEGMDSERIMQQVGSRIAASRGSACSSGGTKASHVLQAMGLKNSEAHASIRFSFGRYTSEEEIEKACDILYKIF